MTNQRDLANETLSLSHTHLQESVCGCFVLFSVCYVRDLLANLGKSMTEKKKLTLPSFFPPPCLLQMEEVIARMQDEKNGIPIRTVKSFLTKIPSVFSGKASVAALLLPPSSVLADSLF